MGKNPYSGFCIIFLILALCCLFWYAIGSHAKDAILMLCVCCFLAGFTGIMSSLDG